MDTTEEKESGIILLFNHPRPECGLKKKKKKMEHKFFMELIIQYQTEIYFKRTLSGARNLRFFITLVLPPK